MKFFEEINLSHDSIKFECKFAYDRINFLDCNVHLSTNGLSTSLYKKPTDRNAYLHYASYHPTNQKSNIPFGQFLRAKKICSNQNESRNAINDIAKSSTREAIRKKPLPTKWKKRTRCPERPY